MGTVRVVAPALPTAALGRQQLLAEKTFALLQPYLTRDDRVLDVGSGHGLVAELISTRVGAQVDCIDVVDVNRSNQPLTLYDGQNIPFADRSFSTVICCFVLHHARCAPRLIAELSRVASERVLVLEDTPVNAVDRVLAWTHAALSKLTFSSAGATFHSPTAWRGVFLAAGLQVDEVVEIPKSRDPIYPVTRRMFVLSRRSDAEVADTAAALAV